MSKGEHSTLSREMFKKSVFGRTRTLRGRTLRVERKVKGECVVCKY